MRHRHRHHCCHWHEGDGGREGDSEGVLLLLLLHCWSALPVVA